MEGETQCSGSRLSDNVTTACICVVTEWKWVSLKKKKKKKKFFFFFFLGRLPLLPGSHLGRIVGPQGDRFALVAPLLGPCLLTISTHCMQGNFACFCHLIFSKQLFLKNSFRNTIIVSSNLDPDQAWYFVVPNLGPTCWQKFSRWH